MASEAKHEKTRELEAKLRGALASVRASGAWLLTTSRKADNAYQEEIWDCTRPHLSWLRGLNDPTTRWQRGKKRFRACLHGGGGPQVGEVTHFGG